MSPRARTISVRLRGPELAALGAACAMRTKAFVVVEPERGGWLVRLSAARTAGLAQALRREFAAQAAFWEAAERALPAREAAWRAAVAPGAPADQARPAGSMPPEPQWRAADDPLGIRRPWSERT